MSSEQKDRMSAATKTPAKTLAERQAALRQRNADAGLTEVRGVYAKAAHHAKIKAFAKSLAKPAKIA